MAKVRRRSSKQVKKWQEKISLMQESFPFGPLSYKKDLIGRLHSDDEPALVSPTRICWYNEGQKHGIEAYKFGTMVYWWRGRQVPKRFVTKPESLTMKDVFSYKNTELRFVAMQIYGFDRLMKSKRTKILDEVGRGLSKKILFEIKDIIPTPVRILKVIDASKENGEYKCHYLFVSPENKTAKQAVAWTMNCKEGEYNPMIET